MEFKLKIIDRLILLSILPITGDFLEMRLAADLRDRLNFNADEQENFDLKLEDAENGKRYVWDEAKDREIDCSFKNKELDLIKNAFKILDQKKQLTAEHLGTYTKFMED